MHQRRCSIYPCLRIRLTLWNNKNICELAFDWSVCPSHLFITVASKPHESCKYQRACRRLSLLRRHFPTLSVLRRHPSPSRQQFEGLLAIAEAVGIDIRVDDSKQLATCLDNATRQDPYFNKLLRILSTRYVGENKEGVSPPPRKYHPFSTFHVENLVSTVSMFDYCCNTSPNFSDAGA